jgi:hypothetical protein
MDASRQKNQGKEAHNLILFDFVSRNLDHRNQL